MKCAQLIEILEADAHIKVADAVKQCEGLNYRSCRGWLTRNRPDLLDRNKVEVDAREKNVQETIALYESGQSLQQISDKLGPTPATIMHWLHAAGVVMRNKGGNDVADWQPRISANELNRLYIDEGKSMQDIADMYPDAYNNATQVSYDMKKVGIESRNYQEAGQLRYASGR